MENIVPRIVSNREYSMKIKRFVIFTILETLKSRSRQNKFGIISKILQAFEFRKNSFTSGRSLCIDLWFHGQSGKSKRKKWFPHDRAYFIRVQSSFALFPRDNENGGALHILYTDAQKEGGKRVREVFAFNQPLPILKSLWNVSAFDFFPSASPYF